VSCNSRNSDKSERRTSQLSTNRTIRFYACTGAKDETEKVTKIIKNPQKIPKGTQGAIFRAFRNLLKKSWASLAEFCKEFGQTFKDSKSEFAEGSGPWQHLVGCWDFQAEWYDTLPKGTVLLENF
jgi:hypothetical protein